MPTTSPDAIYFADAATVMDVTAISLAEANSIQTALNNKINNRRQIQTYIWADTAARNAQTGMREGDMGYQSDIDLSFRYSDAGWAPFRLGGLTPITPTSIAVAGTSGTINDDGSISFTGLTAMSIRTAFPAGFNVFRLIVESSGTASTLRANFQDGTSNIVTGYDLTRLTGSNGAIASATTLNQTDWVLSGGLSNTHHQATVDIARPMVASPKSVLSNAGLHSNPAAINANNGVSMLYGTQRNSAAYNGFRLTWSAAQSGTVRIFGYT